MLLALAVLSAPTMARDTLVSQLPRPDLVRCLSDAWGKSGLRVTPNDVGNQTDLTIDLPKLFHPINNPLPFWVGRISDDGDHRTVTIGYYKPSMAKSAAKKLRQGAEQCDPNGQVTP